MIREQFKKFLHGISFMLKYTRKLNPDIFLPTACTIILEIANTFSGIFLPQYFIDDITNMSPSRQTLFHLAILIVAIFGVKLLKATMTPYVLKAYNQGDANTALDYALHYVEMEYKDQENDNIRNMQEKLRKNVTANKFVADDLSDFFINLLLVIGFSFTMARLHILIFIVFFAVAICNYILEKKREEYSYEYDKNISKTQRKITYLLGLLLDFQYAKEMRINQASKWTIGKVCEEITEYKQKTSEYTKRVCLFYLLGSVLMWIINAASYVYVALLAFNGSISIGRMTMYISTMFAFARAVNALLVSINRLNMFSVYVKDYEAYLKTIKSSKLSTSSKALYEYKNKYDIEFIDVCFQYPNSDCYALENINLKICTGEKVALVGLNGSGKTTFVKLLCKIYQPSSGKILLNGIDINEIPAEKYAEIISAVFQDYKIFSFTFKDNIILSCKENEEKLYAAVQDSGLKNKLNSLNYGYDTFINKDFSENGIELSGGEGQKLAFARALYKDTPIIILDEPTSAVDAIAEQHFYEEINRLTKDKTSIFISHRMTSTMFCDSVYVFDKGKLAAVGSHNELLQKQGIYEEMFTKQSIYYRA